MKSLKATRRPVQVAEGSGNVFADLGLPEPEVALAKTVLAEAIEDTIRGRGLTQQEGAEIMGIDQGTVSKVMNDRLDGFSMERLIRYLNALGQDVEITVGSSDRSGETGRLVIRRR
jgi:predicted XRE-type DNA-binding protein